MLDFLKHIPDYFMIVLIIVLGSITHSTSLFINARKKKEIFTWVDGITNGVVAGFAGMMFSIGADYMTDSQQLIGFITGIGAVSGLMGINMMTNSLLGVITDMLRTRLGSPNSKKDE